MNFRREAERFSFVKTTCPACGDVVVTLADPRAKTLRTACCAARVDIARSPRSLSPFGFDSDNAKKGSGP